MAVRATMSRFPMDPDAQEGSGLPWGVTVTPFATKDENGNSPVYGSDGHLLPRCENCWAYFNTYCELEQWAWNCSLCGTLNGLTSEAITRYSQPQSCAEMMSSFIDLELPVEGSEGEAMQARPVYVAAIDLSSSEEFLELIKSSLLAALEALGPGALFGLATFSHKIGLYDVQGPVPVVKNVFVPADSDASLPIELEDVMPLLSFLAPVETCKDRIASALETLKPTTSWERTTTAGQGLDGLLLGGRGFGVAMEALFNYLGSEYGNTFALARVFAFLSGPPDYGAGQLDTRRYGEQYASKGEDADRALLPEQTPFYKDLAAVAVQAGVCVDIFAVTNEYTDLASLKFLSIESGGSLFLYSNTDDSTLPQDMYRMLSRPYAFGCILRLRTSSEFRPGNSVSDHIMSFKIVIAVLHFVYFTFTLTLNFCSMVISSQIHSTKMCNTLFVVILMSHMPTTLILPTLLGFPDIHQNLPCYRLHFNTLLLCPLMNFQLQDQFLQVGMVNPTVMINNLVDLVVNLFYSE
ncbi:hypothetical protein PVL29_008220 [Vitis rotundifolia]|uniref:Sec23/sec24 transport family protein n=1 Tax=Vitis rotundifolia TaxID=103349 RepID=A0AA39A328_VITRO|nr:hypothetical protein PVL29_008220 [Vitis rotundifolia]